MKKYILFLIILFLCPFVSVNATEIYNIDMDVFIDNYGNATITEVWDVNVTDGTEGYHPYYNLGKSVISNLSVMMDGEKFTTVYNWNIDGTIHSKAYKAGIYNASNNEVDVCFGITRYGRHVYTIKYDISNFVAKLNDADMVYWNLFPYDFSAKPNNVTITIRSNFSYNNIEIHSYGRGATSNRLINGKIYLDSNGVVDTSEYMTVLIKFPRNTFNNNYYLDNDFEYYHDMANEGAINHNDNSNIFDFIILIVFVFLPFVISIFICLVKDSKKPKYRFGVTGNKVKRNVPNFRDIPCNNDIFRAYWVSYNYRLVKKKENFLGAVLLNWLKNDNIRIEKNEKAKNKTVNNIIFNTKPITENKFECDLFDWMYEASIDGKLENNEFRKWCRKNYSKILKWFDDVLEYQSNILVNEGKAIVTHKKKFIILNYTYYDIDSSMMQEAEQMVGLKKFLKEFSLINEREPIEVKLWNEYLIYAQIFGLAEEVASQFEKLYPEITENLNNMGYEYDDIIFIRSISHNGMNSANAASSSSSSSGGGGGSFGGGGGGGGFR